MWSGGGGAPGWGGWNWNAGAGVEAPAFLVGARVVNGGGPPVTIRVLKV